jgi:hypothetical protein
MQNNVLDAFDDLSGWTAFASGEANLDMSTDAGPGGNAMRLDFDFHGGGGFVGVRKVLPLQLPESYKFGINIRGKAPANILEFKLADPSGQNVWRYRVEAFDFSPDWQPLSIRNSQIEFAWGPLGGGPACSIEAIELVIAAGPGGKGTVWIDQLEFQDLTCRSMPVAQSSGALPGHEPQNALDLLTKTGWRSIATDEHQWLLIDFQQEREYGGLVIDWEPGFQPLQFNVQLSLDGADWKTAYATNQAGADRSYVYLPAAVSRYIKLGLYHSVGGNGFGILSIEVKPYEASRSINNFFHSIAHAEPLGHYPKYFMGRQTYWTLVGTGDGDGQALFNEEGMVEVDRGAFSIEPFLYVNNRLITWADVMLNQDLVNRYLPIPSSEWRMDGLVMKITAFASGQTGRPVLYICYCVENTSRENQPVRLFASVRPFQVTPTWQNWREFGGATPIRDLAFQDEAVWVNGTKAIVPLSPPAGFGAAPFARGSVTRYLKSGEVPDRQEVHDGFGYASGALLFNLNLAPGSAQEIHVAVPFGLVGNGDACIAALKSSSGPVQFAHAIQSWEQQEAGSFEIYVPLQLRRFAYTVKTAAAHIRINRDGPALHPGPRRYCRSWIRDGVVMGAALLRVGCTDALRDFIRWYAGFQSDDGTIPDCTDSEGSEWLPEYDAYGQLIFGIMEYFRFTGDRPFLDEMLPAVAKTLACMENLRAQRLTDEYRQPEKQAYYGLLPASMSHEGYMAHPVHAYWDDFWAICGYRDAARMAEILGDQYEAARLKHEHDSLVNSVQASLAAAIAQHGIDFLPGSVELGDFDPTSSAVAIGLLDLQHLLPESEIRNTFDRYLELLRKRWGGTISWTNYTAYEVRIIGALVRLGKRTEAVELAHYLIKNQRIAAWNQWPEITWFDPASPSFMGDLPHTWISAEFILSACSLFAYEREADQSLVLAAGLPYKWLSDGSPIGVENLSTWYGKLSYSLSLEDADTLCLSLTGTLTMPPGGIVVKPSLPRSIRSVEVNGVVLEAFEADGFTFSQCPAMVVVRF